MGQSKMLHRVGPSQPRLNAFLISGVLAGLLLTVCVAIEFMVETRLSDERRQAIAHLAEESSDHVSYLRTQWINLGEQIAALRKVGEAITQAYAAGRVLQARHLMNDVLPSMMAASGSDFLQMAGIDAKGMLSWSSLPMPASPIDLADREHVRAILVDGQESFVGEPVVGRVSGRLSLQFASAVWDPSGNLLGLVVISVSKARLEMVERVLERGDGWRALLVRHDQRLLSAIPELPGTRMFDMASFSWRSGLGVDVWTTRGKMPDTGVDVTLAATQVPGYGLFLMVVRDELFGLGPLMRSQALTLRVLYVIYAGTMLAWVLTTGFVFSLARMTERRARDRVDLTRLELLSQVARAANDKILLVDKAHRLLFANNAMTSWLSLGRSSPDGPVVAPLWREISASLNDILKSGVGRQVVVSVPTAADAVKWFALDMTPVEIRITEPRRFDALLVISRDVTTLKTAELEVTRLLNEQYLVTRTGPGVPYRALVTDGIRRAFTFPAGTGRLADLLPEGSLADGPKIVSDDIPMLANIRPDLEERGELTVEYHVLSGDGVVHVLRDSMVRVADSDNAMVISGYLIDVSVERDREEQLRKMQRLWMLGELAGGLAHELNQPLAAISVASENALIALERGPAGIPRAEEKLTLISDMVERAGRIIRTMRQAGDTHATAVETVNLREVIDEALQTVRWRLDEQAVDVSVSSSVDTPEAFADRGLLEQVFVNLIANSCDAYRDMEEPKPAAKTIVIEIACQASMICVAFADFAGGIPELVMAKLFQPFQTTKLGGKGTGLGLPVIYNIVTRFGGSISARNENGGTIVDVCMPRESPDDRTVRQGPVAALAMAERVDR